MTVKPAVSFQVRFTRDVISISFGAYNWRHGRRRPLSFIGRAKAED